MIPELIIRADADSSIGAGHLMRCLALAQAWNDTGGSTVFITACDNEKLLNRLRSEGIEVVELKKAYPASIDLDITIRILKAHPVTWSAIDGYHFDHNYQRAIKATGHSLLVIDDTAHLDKYIADFLLNQNICANQLDYSNFYQFPTNLLLGPHYALLRREFTTWRSFKRHIPKVARKLLISFGGSDPNNVTIKTVQALKLLPLSDLEVKVVVGASHQHIDSIDNVCKNSKHPVIILKNVDNMSELMAWADLAVTAGGSTCLELLFMKLPSLTIITAENQRLAAQKMGRLEASVNLGHHEKVTQKQIAEALYQVIMYRATRKKMVEQSMRITDGKGAERVVKKLLAYSGLKE